MSSSAAYSSATSRRPAATVCGEPTTVRRPGGMASSAWPSDSRKRSALSGSGTGIRRPRRSMHHRHPRAGGQALRLLVGVGADGPHADGQRGAPGAPGLDEVRAVALRDLRAGRVDEVREGVGQAELGGPDAALRRGAQQPRLGRVGEAGQGGEAREGWSCGRRSSSSPSSSASWVGKSSGAAWRRSRCSAKVVIGSVPGRAADGEVDAVGEEAGEDAEALGHLERAVVGEHHAAAAHADARRWPSRPGPISTSGLGPASMVPP